jgi:hypothetical protein
MSMMVNIPYNMQAKYVNFVILEMKVPMFFIF